MNLKQEIGEYPKLKKYCDFFSKVFFLLLALITLFLPRFNPISNIILISAALFVPLVVIGMLGVNEKDIKGNTKPVNYQQRASIIRIFAICILVVGITSLIVNPAAQLFWWLLFVVAYSMRVASALNKNVSFVVMYLILSFVFLVGYVLLNEYLGVSFIGILSSIYYLTISFLV